MSPRSGVQARGIRHDDRVGEIRVLFVADTHLGFDLPLRPRIQRRRRGEDFFRNFRTSLEMARGGRIDLVVHGGDLFFRSKVAPSLIARGIALLIEVAESGVPVVLVPGNHERSRLPGALLATHPLLFWFERPRTMLFSRDSEGRLRPSEADAPCDLAVAGFPCERGDVRSRFPDLLSASGALETDARSRLLVFHQAFEGAQVGPSAYTFRSTPDVIAAHDLPEGFAAVLAGHIHRHQVLDRDLEGHALPSPVLYPGSVERTSYAERAETKGFLTLEIEPGPAGGSLSGWRFHPLSTRPMVDLPIRPTGSVEALEELLRTALAQLPKDAIVRLRLLSGPTSEEEGLLSAVNLRRFAASTQNIDTGTSLARGRLSRPSAANPEGAPRDAQPELRWHRPRSAGEDDP